MSETFEDFLSSFWALVKFNKVQLCRTTPHPAGKSALQQKSWGLTAEPIVWYDHSIVIRIVIRKRCFRHNREPHTFYASFGFSYVHKMSYWLRPFHSIPSKLRENCQIFQIATTGVSDVQQHSPTFCATYIFAAWIISKNCDQKISQITFK